MQSHLLVVDDNPTNLKLACDVLESAGYRVERAADAEQALASIARAAPALILLDLALPGMDGLTLARKLKSDAATRDIKIAAMTAFAMRGDEQKARAAGCEGYITKPIDTRQLPQQVADLLAGRAAPLLKKVLIVDDIESSRKLLRVTLEAEGFTVIEAADGIEALAVLERESIDAIIADILMPNMDGYRLCYEVRSSERWYKLPFIIYTNTYTSASDEQVAIELGADFYLRKPATFRAIADALLEAERRSAERQPTRIVWPEDRELLKSYSGRLVAKLEQRNTELQRQAEALEESNRLFTDLTAHLPQVFWMSRVTPREIVYVSPAYERIWGRSCRSLCDRPEAWLEAVHPEDRARVEAAIGGGTISGEYDEEYRIVRPDAEVRWIRDRAFPIRDAAGRVHRLAGLAEDVTERKLAEQTTARLEAQLRNAQRLEALGTLAGGIAHDFNNILAAILANAELMRKRLPQDHAAQENASEILSASQRAGDLVRQILGFSGRQGQPRAPIAVQPIIAEAIKLLRATLPAAVELHTDLASDVPEIHANASQVHQVLVNLCNNAAQAIAERGGRIDIGLSDASVNAELARAHPQLHEGRYARVRVSDSGKGMDEATLAHVFEPFFTTKPPGEGTGLGLSVVHGIVQEHGGAITVRSRPGAGTTFDVYFPAAAGSGREGFAEDVPRGHGERLLVVDDEPAIANLAIKALRELGYHVEAFTQPNAALAAFAARPNAFDLVLTDLDMPGMSGIELTGRVLELRSDVPIILTSGYTNTLEAIHARQLGLRELLTKPFTLEALAHAVRRALAPAAAT